MVSVVSTHELTVRCQLKRMMRNPNQRLWDVRLLCYMQSVKSVDFPAAGVPMPAVEYDVRRDRQLSCHTNCCSGGVCGNFILQLPLSVQAHTPLKIELEGGGP